MPKPKQACVQWSRSLFPTTRYQEAMKLTASIDGDISATGRCLTPGNCLGLNSVVEPSCDAPMHGCGMLWRPICLISCAIKIWGIHLRRDKLSSIAYPERLNSYTI